MFDCITESSTETRELGRRLGAQIRPGDLILLYGDLGSGKTTFVQGVAAGMGATDAVTSPTFTLIHEYGADAGRLVHIDPFRLEAEQDLIEIGIDDYLESGAVMAIEWGERLGSLTPQERLDVRIEILGEDRRQIRMTPHGPAYQSLLEGLGPC